MMEQRTLVYIALALMFVLPGCIALWAGVRGSQWFLRSPSYRYLVEKIGMGWTRALFVLLGLLFLSAALLVIMDPMEVMK